MHPWEEGRLESGRKRGRERWRRKGERRSANSSRTGLCAERNLKDSPECPLPCVPFCFTPSDCHWEPLPSPREAGSGPKRKLYGACGRVTLDFTQSTCYECCIADGVFRAVIDFYAKRHFYYKHAKENLPPAKASSGSSALSAHEKPA